MFYGIPSIKIMVKIKGNPLSNRGVSPVSIYKHTSPYFNDMDAAEQILFALLKKYRVKNRREFFNCELEIIITNMKKVESILIEKNELKSEIETTTAKNKIIETPSVNINITNIQPNITNVQPNITNMQPNITNIQPSGRNQCPLCNKNFSRLHRLESHLKRKSPCQRPNYTQKSPCQRPNYTQKLPKKISIGLKDIKLGPDIIICQYCKKKFSSRDNLAKHLKEGYCRVHFPIDCHQKTNLEDETIQVKSHNEDDFIQDLKGKIQVMEKQISELKEKPLISEKQIEELSAAIIESKEKPLITNVNNQILQVVCINQNDNYLDWGTPQLKIVHYQISSGTVS
jgi:hypothetical protein